MRAVRPQEEITQSETGTRPWAVSVEAREISGKTVPENKELVSGVDEWIQREGAVIRTHKVLRKALFTPKDVDSSQRGCSVDELGDIRVTRGVTETGEEFSIEEFWRASKNPHRLLQERWTGSTEFRRRRCAAQEEESASLLLVDAEDPNGKVVVPARP